MQFARAKFRFVTRFIFRIDYARAIFEAEAVRKKTLARFWAMDHVIDDYFNVTEVENI